MKFLITGGAGFIGSALVRYLISETGHSVVNLDKLTYAANLMSLHSVSDSDRYVLERVDICDPTEVSRVFDQHQPDLVIHLAAESHVDRSIDAPAEFVQTNVVGTLNLLEQSLAYYGKLDGARREAFRVHQVSTDEVYGDLQRGDSPFSEQTPYAPSSPYSASKASADHLVRAWHRTFGLPTLVSNCSNNYGPCQFPEKLIPLMITNALNGKPLPIYGDGRQIRDWLYVEDHARALLRVATDGSIGSTYCIGGSAERENISVVETICEILDRLVPDERRNAASYRDLIKQVPDRPGHDRRYAVDTRLIKQDLGWVPVETFESGLEKTVRWYLDNRDWWRSVADGSYLKWLDDAETRISHA